MNFGLRIFQRNPPALISFRRTMKVMNLEPKLIKDNHSVQFYFGDEFMRKVVSNRKWGDLKRETVMDIGCGTGNNSTQLILKHFPEVGQIIATDASRDIIELAKKTNKHPKVDFIVADIQNRFDQCRWFDEISKIISMFSLQWVVEQKIAFENIYDLLLPGGEAAILLVLTSNNFVANNAIYNDPKWKRFFKDVDCFVPESQVEHYDAFHYQNLLTNCGFDVLLCEENLKKYVFPDDEHCANFLTSLFPDIERIPENLKKELGKDLVAADVDLCGRSGDGRPNFTFSALNILLSKPQ